MVQPLLRVETSPLVGDRRVQALQLLSDREKTRFAADPRPETFLTGRMLLRELAAGFTAQPLESITIAASCPDCDRPHGRPTIEGTELYVSLSHAGDRTVAALLEGSAIGVDIEPRDASAERLAAIREVADGEDLRHWTRVEAVLKADGRGLRIDPREVVVWGDRATLDGRRYQLSEIDDPAYVISVAVAL